MRLNLQFGQKRRALRCSVGADIIRPRRIIWSPYHFRRIGRNLNAHRRATAGRPYSYFQILRMRRKSARIWTDLAAGYRSPPFNGCGLSLVGEGLAPPAQNRFQIPKNGRRIRSFCEFASNDIGLFSGNAGRGKPLPYGVCFRFIRLVEDSSALLPPARGRPPCRRGFSACPP